MSKSPTQLLRGLVAVALAVLHSGCGTPSIAQEKATGAEYQRQIRQQMELFRDSVTVHYIRTIGDELVRNGRPTPFDVRFYVVEDDSLNAFAIPGCKLYVNTGLIMAVESAAQLSSVMAHELGHCTARHWAKRYNKQRGTGFVVNLVYFLAAILTGSQAGAEAGGMLGGIAGTAFLASYSRDDEAEADRLGLETLLKAGWHPHEMQSMFELLQREGGGGGMPAFLMTHPAPPERIAAIGKAIESVQLPANLRVDDGGRLQIIQKRVELLLGTDVLRDDAEDDEDLEEDEDDYEEEDDAGDE